jgi:hypothetical protein
MKIKDFKLLVTIFLSLTILGGIFAIIYSCGSGYFLDPRSIRTATPTANPEATYVPYSVSWTGGIDFTDGEFDGISVSPSGNQLLLETGEPINFQPTHICVAAATENSVWLHKLDDPNTHTSVDLTTIDLDNEGPYVAGGNVNPSRTAIDAEKNCWVGGRANGGVYKIKLVGDPAVATVVGKVRLPGSSPNARAVAIDKNGYIWVGNYKDGKVYKINPNEDVDGMLTIEASYPYTTTVTPNNIFPSATYASTINNPGSYGAAVDSRGNLWLVGYENDRLAPGFVSKIDTVTGNVLCTQRTNMYGIAIGQVDYPWVGGYNGNTLSKIKKDCSGFELLIDLNTWKITRNDGVLWENMNGSLGFSASDHYTRGVGMDTGGNIWVADSTNDYVYKFADNGNYLGKVKVGSSPIGVSGDPTIDTESGNPLGRVWAVNQGSDNISRIMGSDISPTGDNNSGLDDKVDNFATGDGPYSYSDMVGFGLFTTVLRNQGTWKVKFDSGYDNPNWTSLSWHAKVNDSTQVSIRVRVAADEASLESATWSASYNESPAILDVEDLRWIQLEINFYTLDARYSPILDDLSINFELPNG